MEMDLISVHTTSVRPIERLRSVLTAVLSAAALTASFWGVKEALHSPLFLVQIVETNDVADDSPVTAQSIVQRAAVRVGKVNLFDLDIAEVEKRILTDPWIRSVQIEKRFPQTVAITPVFREPRALIQMSDGKMTYVDSTGQTFGKVQIGVHSGLPVLAPTVQGNKLITALRVLDQWTVSDLAAQGRVDSIDFDSERGFRLLVTYRIGPLHDRKGRAMVDIGDLSDAAVEAHFAKTLAQLRSVFQYLSDNQIAARQIWADLGKKIVVKIARGS